MAIEYLKNVNTGLAAAVLSGIVGCASAGDSPTSTNLEKITNSAVPSINTAVQEPVSAEAFYLHRSGRTPYDGNPDAGNGNLHYELDKNILRRTRSFRIDLDRDFEYEIHPSSQHIFDKKGNSFDGYRIDLSKGTIQRLSGKNEKYSSISVERNDGHVIDITFTIPKNRR